MRCNKPCEKAYLHYEARYDWEYNEWRIAINTLQELKDLIKEVGEIVMSEDEIEIYDTLRE